MSTAVDLDPTDSVLKFFAAELRRLRGTMKQADLARKTHVARSTLNKYEAATRVPSKDFAHAADEVLQTGGALTRLWPLVIKYAYPAWFQPFVELESAARIIRSYENQVIPGLLQTEPYARALLAGGRHDNLDDLVTLRLERQRLLEREDRPRLTALIDEQALRKSIGGRNVMRAQLEHLLKSAAAARTIVLIVPSSVSNRPPYQPFTRLAFEPGTQDVLYVDGFHQGQLLADAAALEAAESAYDLLMAAALSPDASRDLIASVSKEPIQ
ncbi:helix-turn-helix transcriptional regulator [Embleya sp. NPDC059237]|uniref:helix-turn-helix domain-containing protein n=1 Tax=Embleya sp. NPDC059237 TaxID=3346784 RepID=UPI003697006B